MNTYVGLVPAAGNASRLKTLLSGSKEIYPITIQDRQGIEQSYPVCKCLLDSFKGSGVNEVCVILRENKKDITEVLGDGKGYGVEISYVYTEPTYGPAYTLDKAYSQVKNKHVALGFPDILFKPREAFKALINKQQVSSADVVLALFVAPNPNKMDMVVFDELDNIIGIDIKPEKTSLIYTWILAVWNPTFSEFMHLRLKKLLNEFKTNQRNECHVGTIFKMALKEGIIFDYVMFDDGELMDIGTPEDFSKIKQQTNLWFK